MLSALFRLQEAGGGGGKKLEWLGTRLAMEIVFHGCEKRCIEGLASFPGSLLCTVSDEKLDERAWEQGYGRPGCEAIILPH